MTINNQWIHHYIYANLTVIAGPREAPHKSSPYTHNFTSLHMVPIFKYLYFLIMTLGY